MNFRNKVFSFLLCCSPFTSFGQVVLPVYADSLFPTYYQQRVSLFNGLPKTADEVIFLGDSITDGGEWSELFKNVNIKNRGISSDVTAGVLHRLKDVADRKPAKIFLMIGVNDLARNISPDSVVSNLMLIARYVKELSPNTKLYIQDILPVNDAFQKFKGHIRKGKEINEVNQLVHKNAAAYNYIAVPLHAAFSNKEGKLRAELTNEGLHLKGEAYLRWKHLIYPYVYDLQQKPALIPEPKKVSWNAGVFNLLECKSLLIADDSLRSEALGLQKYLQDKNLNLNISKKVITGTPLIEIKIISNPRTFINKEAYEIEINENKVLFSASSRHGIFNAIQTFKQLVRDNIMIDACTISDAPAFSWRGYMVDVGRNYQSVAQLKEQIDVMAAYKFNVFHLHLTEDIAWRVESKKYPKLTATKNMLHNPGEFYSIPDLKDLIDYCNERHIEFVPEIDMPGHSAAFQRAMGVDMQSAEGVEICKNILTELCAELELNYIHIGGDEVHISNKNFLPRIVEHLRSLGKKVIAWDPGGNVPEGTMLQMWNGNSKTKDNYPAIDSRHLYLNHFDPFDGVVATFNHIIDDVENGDELRPGATLCNWPDRRVNNESQLISMNAVYPVMLTFAERCWAGGGVQNFKSDMGKPGDKNFQQFQVLESKLLDHKKQYFKNSSFPYFKQTDIEWTLIGPFDNNGKTEKIFPPENKIFLDTMQVQKYLFVYGATIWLRHFWSPMIDSHLSKSTENTTWYATRKIWAEEAGEQNFWIGFNNFSRSTATDEPPVGKWDNRGSKVWVNGTEVNAPKWYRGGNKGDSEIPMTDENYPDRAPTKIFLKKGWNTVLIKAPVRSFKGTDWQNPVKWMFTFIKVSKN